MSFREPHNVGSTSSEPPEVIWNVLVEVEFDPELSAENIDALQAKLWDVLNDVTRAALWPHTRQPASVQITAVNGRGETTPVFPMVAGKRHFTCNLDLEEEKTAIFRFRFTDGTVAEATSSITRAVVLSRPELCTDCSTSCCATLGPSSGPRGERSVSSIWRSQRPSTKPSEQIRNLSPTR